MGAENYCNLLCIIPPFRSNASAMTLQYPYTPGSSYHLHVRLTDNAQYRVRTRAAQNYGIYQILVARQCARMLSLRCSPPSPHAGDGRNTTLVPRKTDVKTTTESTSGATCHAMHQTHPLNNISNLISFKYNWRGHNPENRTTDVYNRYLPSAHRTQRF